jgi:hypothetical protein
MTTQFDSAVARIYAQGDRIIGAGFLVRDRQVLTCAHVVASAAGLSGNAQEPPDSVVHLDFPLVDRHRRIPARVVHWVPVDADGEGDIAGLELLEDPPADVQPARLVVAEEVWGHQYRAFGFPAGYDDGVWVSGRVLARQAIQWVQLDVGQPGYRMESGFSGAPVWDDELEGVVGMAVATETRTDVRTAYLIPTGFLIDAWPSLTTQAIPPSPYRGLSAFREQDAQFFFGRDDVIDELSNRIRQHPIVSVVGPSGSGKSSVVLAGLIPRLRADGHWITVSVRPSTQQSAFEALAIALLPFLEPTMSEAGWLQELPALSAVLAGGRLPQAASRILEKTGASRLLIVVDQLEELYTSTASGRQEFVASLLEAASAGGQRSQPELVMVLTIRADFLGHVMAHPGFTEALQGALVMVGPMSMVNLRQAIERPVSHRVTFEPGLIERILGDVGTAPGNLPLLEFSLTLLWQRQVLGHLTHAAYDQLGGVAGSLTRYAEEVYAGLSEPEQQDMRRIFVQLTIPGQDTGHTRRTALRSDLGDDRWALVQRLATSRLLVTGQDLAGGETVELAHEALLTGWSRLHHWIQEDRDFRVWQEETRSAIRRWEMSSRDEGGLLRGVLLVEAEQWLERRADDLSSTEQTFIRASGNLRDREEPKRDGVDGCDACQPHWLSSRL